MQRKLDKQASLPADALFTAPDAPRIEDVTPARIAPLKPTPVYDTYWRFAAERQRVFFRRQRNEPAPWTDDKILRTYKFTNAYRASDRVSQFLIRHVIYRSDLPGSPDEIVFRILLFKLFNRIETWELLERQFGQITSEDFSFRQFDRVLTRALGKGKRIYSAAYIMPSGGSLGHARKHRNHLTLIERMLDSDVAGQLADARSMQRGFDVLRSFPTIGDFLAYQFITDINYSDVTRFTEMEFVVPGPGAIDGIRKCFFDTGGLNDAEVIRFMVDRQEIEFERLGIPFETLWGRRLQLIDCQNLFCEVGKYARVRHPEFAGVSGRTRIKQNFSASDEPIEHFYPPKWRLAMGTPPHRTADSMAAIPQLLAPGRQAMNFDAYQDEVNKTDRNPATNEKGMMIPLLGLAGEAGELITEYKKRLRDGASHLQFRDRFSEELGDVLWYLANLATKFDLRLGEVARRNLAKCHERWGELPKRKPFDHGFPENEQLPRRFLIDFATTYDENEKPVVRVYYKGDQFGSALTDNAREEDGYSYHDILHLSFAAVLGWSPLTRALLGVKRKSHPDIDEIEDGGRAIATEEGLSTMIFAYARDYNWLEGKSSISSELLRMIKNMTLHLEVRDCTTGEWESAIMQGFSVWREISRRKAGTLVVDLDSRTLSIKES